MDKIWGVMKLETFLIIGKECFMGGGIVAGIMDKVCVVARDPDDWFVRRFLHGWVSF